MKQLLKAAKDLGFDKDYAVMNVVTKADAQDFLDWLCERDLIHESKIYLKTKWDADYFGHAQHLVVDGTIYNLVTVLTPVWMVLLHEIAHCLVFRCDPDWAMDHPNEHGTVFEKALIATYHMYLEYKGE